MHPTWVLETEVLAGLDHPLLTLFSPTFLQDRLATYRVLRDGGYTELVVYLAQQVQQFHSLGEEFAMQHLGAEKDLAKVMREIYESMSPKERLEVFGTDPRLEKSLSPEERLEGISAEERLQSLSPDERLKGLSPEERLQGLTPEQLEQLRRLLQQPPSGQSGSSSPTGA